MRRLVSISLFSICSFLSSRMSAYVSWTRAQESAIKFLSYESAKRVFAQYWDRVPDQTLISNSSRFVAGGIGGVVSQFCIYPIESLKVRFPLPSFSSLWKRD